MRAGTYVQFSRGVRGEGHEGRRPRVYWRVRVRGARRRGPEGREESSEPRNNETSKKPSSTPQELHATESAVEAWVVDGPLGATGVLSRGVPPVKWVWGAAPGGPPQAPIFWGFFD